MLFSSSNRHSIPEIVLKIDNQLIAKVESTKFLGVIIDSNLSWEPHAKHIRNKIAKGIGVISKAKKISSRSDIKNIVFFFCVPIPYIWN